MPSGIGYRYFQKIMNENNVKTIDALQYGDELVDLINSGAKMPILITGSSMLPFLKEGRDTVWLTKEENFHRGQILFFRRSNGMFILHRIRKIYPDGRILVNGDAQTWCEIVHPKQAVAVVCAIGRDGKIIGADSLLLKIRDFIWYPTRPIRLVIFRIYAMLKKIFKR